MGLIGGMAKTAVVAGTATAVSGRVSRRQANRWAAQQPAPEPPPQQYQQPPPQAYAPPPPPQEAPAADAPDMLEQLQKLGELRAAGVLTEDEFAAQKAKILAQ
jgi:hypothetical protein